MARRRKPAMRSRKHNNLGSVIMISLVLTMIFAVVAYKNNELEEKKAVYAKKEAYLLEQIEAQNERTKEIEEYGKYMQTKQYIEDMAKSRLGLVYKDEIILEAEN